MTKMQSTMSYRKWDIVLVPFPFTDLKTQKKRPALVLSPEHYNSGPDIVILFITSNLSAFGRPGDYKLSEWKSSGLPKPSMTRMKFATINKSLVLKKLGSVTKADQELINEKLSVFFAL